MITRSCSFLASLFLSLVCGATHIIGGEIYYDHLGGDQYQVTLTLYRDCGGIPFDESAVIGVFSGLGEFQFQESLPFPGGSLVPIALDSPCLTLPPDICVETASYTGVFTLPARPDGYVLSYQRCCRTDEIVNLPNPGELGLTCTVEVPGIPFSNNSSPRFNEVPPVALCLGAPLVFDHSATDPDGDQLSYSLCTPYNGGTSLAPQPVPPSAPPYTPLPWGTGYSSGYPIDSDPAIQIDPVTGVLTLTPTLIGNFVVAVCVQEVRDGVVLSTSRRDLMFSVVPCDAVVSAGIQPQAQFCSGLGFQFGNSSFGAQIWSWDFGDPTTDADTSLLFAPSWTYSAPGVYTVTVIAAPGEICADTALVQFQAFLAPRPTFVPPAPACGDTTVVLQAEGEYGPEATFNWVLGTSAEPSTATGSPVTVLYTAADPQTVTLIVNDNGCFGSASGTVVVSPEPEAFLTVFPASPQLVGVPFTFTDASQSNGAAIVSRTWTVNGAPVAVSGPGLVAEDWLPGTYTVTLTLVTDAGCASTYSMVYVVLAGEIDIPNVFSPNGDGENETFDITNIGYYDNELTIYNRWGTVVYNTRNYRNQWNGGDAPDGTYYYVLVLKDGRDYAGHLTLLR
ncbi:MAG: gliding motility-associated C-terminal domain-containing protein [Flavobacteriales bacterium]|jgi:gliding motility-associated-like protein